MKFGVSGLVGDKAPRLSAKPTLLYVGTWVHGLYSRV